MTTSPPSPLSDWPQMDLPSMSSAEGSPAKTSAMRVPGLGLAALARASSGKSSDWFASLSQQDGDPSTSFWKTSQRSLVEDLEKFSGPWPRSGMISGGIAYQLSPLAPLTGATESGLLPTPEASNTKALAMRSGGRSPRNFLAPLWPTPTAVEGRRGNQPPRSHDKGVPLAQMVALYPTPRATDGTKGLRTPEGAAREVERNKGPDLGAVVGGSLNPTWVEWLMGFPLEWTACMASAMRSSRKSQKS